MAPQRILVTGATGQQGGACLNALLAQPGAYELYALTRSARSPAAQKLAARGVHLVEGNMAAPGAVLAQVPAPLDGIFYVSVFSGPGQTGTPFLLVLRETASPTRARTVETEERQGKAFFDAAQAAGVRHFVYTSVARGGFVPTAVPHFASKHAIEAHIRTAARDTNWTVLQPVAFMDNMLAGGLQARAFFTSLKYYLGQKPLQYIAAADIGKFAARVLAVRALVAVTFAVDAHAAHTGPG
jgi:uncharacterized protein YbjT (DUF2867 family)